jgi:hypothetical protein
MLVQLELLAQQELAQVEQREFKVQLELERKVLQAQLV